MLDLDEIEDSIEGITMPNMSGPSYRAKRGRIENFDIRLRFDGLFARNRSSMIASQRTRSRS
jgi:hypothetical protein